MPRFDPHLESKCEYYNIYIYIHINIHIYIYMYLFISHMECLSLGIDFRLGAMEHICRLCGSEAQHRVLAARLLASMKCRKPTRVAPVRMSKAVMA